MMGRLAALALLIPLLLSGCSRLGSDVDALADSVVKKSGSIWEKKFSLGLGSAAFGLARAGLSFVDLPIEARSALETVHSADFKVYQSRPGAKEVTGMEMIAQADRSMNRRGLERSITVCQKGQLVAVYLPVDATSPNQLEICLLVRDGENLVIAGAQSNLEPLMRWVEKLELGKQLETPELAQATPADFQIVGRSR